ncbi:MAG: YopX family protein [Streptococcus vestibularis]|nr:YopX family protein [Streptococcus vestibularis]
MIPRYRAWDKSTKVMYDDGDIVSIDIEKSQIYVKTPFFEQLSCYNFRDIDLMQSTGFTDNDGKDIFRGDIVTSRGGLFKGVVSLRQDLGVYVINLIGYNHFERLCNVADSTHIIGNIWENPDLLEVD